MNVSLPNPSTPQNLTVNRLGRYLPLVLWMAVISYASTGEFSAINTSRIIRPLLLWLFPNAAPETLAAVHFAIRKAAHFGEYCLLGLLSARAFRKSTHLVLQRHWFLVALLLIAVYALLDEYHQSFVASRTASIYDSFIDMTGGLTALIFVSRFKRGLN